MKPEDVLDKAREIYAERGREYGNVQDLHGRIAAVASELTRRELSARDVALVLMSVKLVRLAQDPRHVDSYVDLVNYTAFACSFAISPDVNKEPPAWVQDACLRAVGTEVGTSVT
jgi:hypothetical protein